MADAEEKVEDEANEDGEVTDDVPPPETDSEDVPKPEDEEGISGEVVLPQESAPLESNSSFPLKDEAVMKELAEADAKAKKTASLIEHLRGVIDELSKKENLTEEDARLMHEKQAELMEQFSELEAASKRIEELLGTQAVSSSLLGPPFQCKDYGSFADPCKAVKELKTPQLPKVIICGNDSQSQMPKIIVCDSIGKKDPKGPVFQQLPGRPQNIGNQSPCKDRRDVIEEPFSRGYGSRDQQATGPQGLIGKMQPMQAGPMTMGRQPVPGFGPQFMPGGPGSMGLPGMMAQPRMLGHLGMMGQPRMMGQASIMGQPGMMGQASIMGQPGMMDQTRMMMMAQEGMVGQPMTGLGMLNNNFTETGQSNMRASPWITTGPEGMMGGQGGVQPNRGRPQQEVPEIQGSLENLSPEEMQKKLQQLEAENKNLSTENNELKKKLACPTGNRFPEKPMCKMTLGKVPVCKLDLYRQMDLPLPSPIQPTENMVAKQGQPMCKRMLASGQPACRLDVYREMGLPYPGLGVAGDASTKDMETMVASMEEEVNTIKKELDSVQAERRALELQRKLLQCAAPAIDQPTNLESPPTAPCGQPALPPPPPTVSQTPGNGMQLQLQLRELREQYNKLQQDFNLKVEEVSLLRVELESAKRESLISIEKSEEAEAKLDDLLERLRAAENERQKMAVTRDQMIELEQQLIMAKQRYREASEEAEEMKAQLNEQIMQVEEYREKYLKAQETVEEQRRQLDLNEMESSRFGDQVALEIKRVKNQFQAKLEELTPLPEMLKKSQEKLKEALHLKALAEKNCMIMSKNLESANEQKEKLRKQLDEISKNKMASEAEKASLQGNLTDGEKKMEETKAENSKLRAALSRLEDLALQNERKFEEKVHETLQLQSQLETLREESARQVSRTKDRCENIRRTFLGQISELERQLASARALTKAAQKDRDDIREKMQAQIRNLNDNLEQAQMRIRMLQSHVNYLKNSYTNIIAPLDAPISIDKLYPDENT